MLEQTHDALWVAEGEIVTFFGVPYPTRSAIVRLANGDLWVWSPVKLTADLRAEVDRLARFVTSSARTSSTTSIWRNGKRPFLARNCGDHNRRSRNVPTSSSAQRCRMILPPSGSPTSIRHGSGALSRWTSRVSSPSLGHGDRRRLDPNIQRRVSAKTLGLVQLPGASGWSHPGSGLRAAGMAMVIHQPRACASGARQGAGLEVPKSDRGAWRETRLHRPGVSNQVVRMARGLKWVASLPGVGTGSHCGLGVAYEQHVGSYRCLANAALTRRRTSTPGCRASWPCRRGCPGCQCRGSAGRRSAGSPAARRCA